MLAQLKTPFKSDVVDIRQRLVNVILAVISLVIMRCNQLIF